MEKIRAVFEKSKLVAQHAEINFPFYQPGLEFLKENINYIPLCVKRALRKKNIYSINAGVIGGSDIDFIHRYSSEALQFISRNSDAFNAPGIGHMNYLSEQLVFASLARQEGKNINFLLPDVSSNYENLTLFHHTPKYKTFIHLVGIAKKNRIACKMVEMNLQNDHNEYYQRIESLTRTGEKSKELHKAEPAFFYTLKMLHFHGQSPRNHRKSDQKKILYKHITSLKKYHFYALLIEIFKLESEHYKLKQKKGISRDDESRYACFKKSVSFLSANSKRKVLQKKFRFSQFASISLSNYNITKLFLQEGWQKLSLEHAGFSIPPYVFLHIKYSPAIVNSTELKGTEKLLYYLHKYNLNGNDLVSIVANEDRTKPRSYYRELIYNFLAEQLMYSNNISPRREYHKSKGK